MRILLLRPDPGNDHFGLDPFFRVDLAREVRRRAPDAFVLVGGHAAAAYPPPLEDPAIDAVCLGDP